MRGQRSRIGSGCIIAGNRVLTNAHVVSDHTFIRVRRAGQADKFVASVDAKKVERYVFPDKYGVHRCATFGDFRERIKDVGALLGFTVIEEDV